MDDSFWHTNEYIKNTGSFSWHTAICNFQVSTGPVNQSPVVAISLPENGSLWAQGAEVAFLGSASDAEDGDLSDYLSWTSSLDGDLGTGAAITKTSLSLGSHTITAQVTDAGGKPGQAQVSITVYDPFPASTMSVAGIATSVTGGAKKKQGMATVTVRDNKGNPVQGATVTGEFSGTITQSGATGVTDALGVAVILTSSTTAAKTVTVSFCVSNLTHASLSYDPAGNAGGTTCSAPPPPPEDQVVHVAAVTTGTSGNKRVKGTATVTVHRADHAAASGVVVTGQFSGSFNETVSGTTGSDGMVTLTTSSQTVNPTFSFCVETLSGIGIMYDASANHPDVAVCGGASKGAIADAMPARVSLEPNYPNPFNPSTMITFALTEGSPVLLRVFNLQGREVARLADGYREAGSHNVLFDASSLSAGVYVYTLQAAGGVQTRRMTILK